MRLVKNNIYFLLTILLGFALRVWNIEGTPPSLNWDEISHGYNAYSILKTGHDEWGNFLPIIFRAYGDYKLPVYIYTTVITVAIFGLNEFAVRLPSVIAGTALILFSFLLAKELFNKQIALFTAFLVAIEPWSFFLSRGAFEANLAVTSITAGVYFFVRAVNYNKNNLIFSVLLFSLSVWTYNSARVFVPFFIIALVLIYKRELFSIKKKLIIPVLILLFFFIPMFLQLGQTTGQARYENVAILDQGAINSINQAQASSGRLLNNKFTYFAVHFASNWLSHFSPEFLFFKGGNNYQFNVQNYGLLYTFDLVLLVLGLYALFKFKGKQKWIIFCWLILAPIASSVTREAPHTLRSITFLPLPMVISALGINFYKNIKYASAAILVAFSIYCGLATGYIKIYFNDYKVKYSEAWQYGYKQTVEYAKQNYDKYDQVVVTKKYGEPHEFFLFYWPWDPEKFRNDKNLERYMQSNWYWVDRLDKFYFVNDWDIPKEENGIWKTERKEVIDVGKKTLLITSPNNFPPGWRKLETINFLDGKPAFDILEN